MVGWVEKVDWLSRRLLRACSKLWVVDTERKSQRLDFHKIMHLPLEGLLNLEQMLLGVVAMLNPRY
jgi:hypothetical protein